MTIKELCNKHESCKTCPFNDACEWLDCNPPFRNDDDDDIAVTRSIIETAKMLVSDGEIHYNG
jgi:16S rRNA G1207 methylase RsmC